MARPRARKGVLDPATRNFQQALERTRIHPIFAPLAFRASIIRSPDCPYPEKGYAVVEDTGQVYCHPGRRAEAEEWAYVLAHCLLHLGLGHFLDRRQPDLWNLACDIYVSGFLADLRYGRPPPGIEIAPPELRGKSEDDLYRYLQDKEIREKLTGFGVGNPKERSMLFAAQTHRPHRTIYSTPPSWEASLAAGLRHAATRAVDVAAGASESLLDTKPKVSIAQRAKAWFISSYPLLGALASAIEIVEDIGLCQRMDISVAAVDPSLKEIYVNPAAGLTEEECLFVVAHELLHVGLRHDRRHRGRDPYLWNVACDYVINGWLVEMQVGAPPQVGLLYDPDLKGLSAEAVYDRIAVDLRRLRRLATLRGQGACDLLGPQQKDIWALPQGTDLDAFYRRCLLRGLEYHRSEGRGLLPAGLVEEIKALAHPPIPWDVELAQWFDGFFRPIERVRSYARPSRRQSATPDIPRPRHVVNLEAEQNRTFGVVLDTSGSMDRHLLAKALGAIVSYSLARDVDRIRLVFCDAAAYDEGYVAPEELAQRVRVKGRGGTALQPGIDLLERAKDFPKKAPLLLITDGACEPLRIKREHAFLMPSFGHLPFAPRGEVFRVE